jgi:hypothetical protein
VSAVEIGLVSNIAIESIHPSEGVHRPNIPMFIGEFVRKIAAIGIAFFYNEILSQALGLVQIELIVFEQFIPINIGDLIKQLHE